MAATADSPSWEERDLNTALDILDSIQPEIQNKDSYKLRKDQSCRENDEDDDNYLPQSNIAIEAIDGGDWATYLEVDINQNSEVEIKPSLISTINPVFSSEAAKTDLNIAEIIQMLSVDSATRFILYNVVNCLRFCKKLLPS